MVALVGSRTGFRAIIAQARNHGAGLRILASTPVRLLVLRQIPKIATRLAGISDTEIVASVARVASMKSVAIVAIATSYPG